MVSYNIVVVVNWINERPELLMPCFTIINNLNDQLFFVGPSYHRKSLFNPQIYSILPLFPSTGLLKWSEIWEYIKCQKDYSTQPCHACCFIVLIYTELHSLFALLHYLRMRRLEVEHSLVWIGHINGLCTLLARWWQESNILFAGATHHSRSHWQRKVQRLFLATLLSVLYEDAFKKVYWQEASYTQ